MTKLEHLLRTKAWAEEILDSEICPEGYDIDEVQDILFETEDHIDRLTSPKGCSKMGRFDD